MARSLNAALKEEDDSGRRFNAKIMVAIQKQSLKDEAELWKEMVSVKIPPSEGAAGHWAIVVNCCGKNFVIPRNEVVPIPRPVYEGLVTGCLETRYQPKIDEHGDMEMIVKEIPRFNIHLQGALFQFPKMQTGQEE